MREVSFFLIIKFYRSFSLLSQHYFSLDVLSLPWDMLKLCRSLLGRFQVLVVFWTFSLNCPL